MKKILITGGSGFLGSHVADAFSKSGYKVTILDKNKSPWIQSNQNFILGNILDEKAIFNAIKDKDAVYHFAGSADIDKANEESIETIKHNIIGTANLLEACVKHKIKRFVFASSIYVYSEHGGFYRSTKQACELIIENYCKLKHQKFTTLRFGSLYGKRGNYFNFIYQAIYSAIKEGKIDRIGDGEEIRDYIHVDDAAKACVSILDKKFENKYIILTGSQSIKVKDLLNLIQELIGKKIKINFLHSNSDAHYKITPYSFQPRVAEKFKENEQIDLKNGILDTINYVKKELNK